MKKSRKYALLDSDKISKISLALATPEDVEKWSHGEVTKPETINYKSYKPERGGLFDEIIFGPMIDYRCPVCGHKWKKINEGSFCTKTELCKQEHVEILPKISRRNHMGHIKLNSPVVHFWFFKVDHSIIYKLLGLKVANNEEPVKRIDLENLIYYKSHIVLESGGLKSLPKNTIIDINEAANIYKSALEELIQRFEKGTEEYEDIRETLDDLVEKATSKIGQDYGIDFYELNMVIEHYTEAKIGTGSLAIEYLLKNIDLKHEKELVMQEIKQINIDEVEGRWSTTSKQNREKLYKRLQVLNAFIESGQKPTSMLIYNLPVIPADLRPLIQLDGGRHSSSDINELYRRVIIRNNRLKQWQEKDAPTLVVQNELRMIQEAVDALIDNQRRTPSPVLSKDNRPFKSISDALTGKKGRFRQNLLGKRVDYSGRSVIVVGPELKMHQCGIPREMAAKLFEPWIVESLIDNGEATTVKQAKKMIEDQNSVIWPYVAKAIEGRLVLLNRAPTLHRLSIQAFEPVLVRGKAIKLHPLVCTPFNADFDGDQMAVHVPVSEQALLEARELMLANKNILGPKDGEPIINPSQDMVLGIYYLTIEEEGALGEGRIFDSFDHMMRVYAERKVSLHARVALPLSEVKDAKLFNIPISKREYIISTVGKFIFNNIFPRTFSFIYDNNVAKYTTLEQYNQSMYKYIVPSGTNILEYIKRNLTILPAFNKKNIARIIRHIFDKYVATVSLQKVASVIAKINEISSDDIILEYLSLTNYEDKKINKEHAILLNAFTHEEMKKNVLYSQAKSSSTALHTYSPEQKANILDRVWFRYTNIVASILDDIKDLGFEYSTISGISISFSDILETNMKSKYIKEGDDYISQLREYYNQGMITDDDRYKLTIEKWSNVKNNIQKELEQIIKENPQNPVITMINSGARGNISNYVQLAGMRGLMANNIKTTKADARNDRIVRSTVEMPVKSSFIEGLTAFEFYSSTHGARKGLTDTALNTAKSGYLTRRLVDVAQNIVVREENCGSDYGYIARTIVDTKTNQVIVGLKERIVGRFANKPIFKQDGSTLIVPRNGLITEKIADIILQEGYTEIEIRSILGCNTRNGVCKLCFGNDLATNRIVNIGEAVGIIAAQSIGEPGTQLTMRTFHTGGVAGGEDITGGFARLIELIDAHEQPWGRPAVISPYEGKIVKIEENTENKNIVSHIVYIEHKLSDGEIEITPIEVTSNKKLRVSEGSSVRIGQKLSEGPIILKELLELTDTITVQNYLLKEIQKIYRIQGIAISDKYIEIIIRQMMSKIVISNPGDSKFFAGAIVDIFDYQEENANLLAEGKKPAYGTVVIKGAKQVPLLSDSFLSAASYQETSKILVHAAISSRSDKLLGLKENIIIGKKIPAGTSLFPFEENSKYDIRPSINYFRSPEEDEEMTFDSFAPLDLEEIRNEVDSETEPMVSVEDEENQEEFIFDEEAEDDDAQNADYE
ncbi:DNA-directed RNA polymerase subunit beta' [Metamycoplasma hyosynoviae]|uniref:DNA-directed RNA polymerase subunit beta' n=1 Tax=Metamycoplasma hyosynoviae TaxID=29559 RepID=UPI0023599B10|nr:DNA-directed RNA polymerase subunit beta' [Metamycoplasma hyosynoviae]MDC8919247.1 DNA-directed RNA polymerase subunit beta' [Metamycoplasma hyosynoviae]